MYGITIYAVKEIRINFYFFEMAFVKYCANYKQKEAHMKILKRLLILLLTSFLFLMSVGAEEPTKSDEQQTITLNAENVEEEVNKILENGTNAIVEENNNKISEDTENTETAEEGENTTVEASTQVSNPSTKEENISNPNNSELTEDQQQPELGNLTYELTYNEDHTIATVTLTYEGECEELTIANQEGIQELVNIGVYQMDMERSDWINTIVFNILLNGAFHFDINVWSAEDLIGTGTVVGYITGLNNDALVFEPNQAEQSTYTTVSSDVGVSDSQSLEISYVTNISYTWTIPTALELSDINGSLPITINNSNLAPETALRVKINTANGFNLTNSEVDDDLSYIVTDNNGERVHNGDVILDHLFNQDTSSNTLNVNITRMPVYSGEYKDTWTFTASVERLLSDLYSGQVVTIDQLGTTHNLIDMKIYGVGYQSQTEGKNIWNEQWETGGYNYVYGQKTTDSSRIRSKDIEVNQFVGKKIYATHDLHIFAYNESKEYIGYKIIGKGNSYTVEDGTYYITFETLVTYGGVYKYDIALSLDENVKYEPYSNLKPSPALDNPSEILSVVNPSVKVGGKNLLNPTLKTITINGVTCTNNGDGTYTLNGTATDNINFYLQDKPMFNCKCKLTGMVSSENNQYKVYLQYSNRVDYEFTDKGQGVIIDSQFDYTAYPNSKIQIWVASGSVINNLVVKPMLTNDLSATYDDFEPYLGKSQTATLPYTLNAISVSEGGNITVNGQQYISDYVDIENKKIVRMVGEIDFADTQLTKSHFSKGTICSSMVFYLDQSAKYTAYNVYINAMNTHILKMENPYWSYQDGNDTESFADGSISFNKDYFKVYLPVSLNLETEDDFANYLKERKLKIIYELETPIEVPLTDAEVQGFKDLHTYSPTTVISCSSDQLTPYIEFGLS